MPDSVAKEGFGSTYNGLINRNLRLGIAMIDMSKPYIMVEKIEKVRIEGSERLQVEFTLNGCVNVTQVSFSINGQTQILNTDGYCNHLVPKDKV
jgi:spore germination protein GerM